MLYLCDLTCTLGCILRIKMEDHASETAAPLHRLPADMWMEIFRHFASYEVCLQHTSLVCKEWCVVGRWHALFRDYVKREYGDGEPSLDVYRTWRIICRRVPAHGTNAVEQALDMGWTRHMLFQRWDDDLPSFRVDWNVPPPLVQLYAWICAFLSRTVARLMMMFPGCACYVFLDPVMYTPAYRRHCQDILDTYFRGRHARYSTEGLCLEHGAVDRARLCTRKIYTNGSQAMFPTQPFDAQNCKRCTTDSDMLQAHRRLGLTCSFRAGQATFGDGIDVVGVWM